MTTFDESKEIIEAINAANDALFHLEESKKLLDSSKNWGIFDLLGGGLIVSMIKRGKMREAQEEMRESKIALDRLNKELGDVNRHLDLSFDMDGFMDMADIIFDGFISDFVSQDKINRARKMVDEAIDDVEEVLDVLESQLS